MNEDQWDDLSPFDADFEFLSPPGGTLPDCDQNHPDWTTFLVTFSSSEAYSKRVEDFIRWQVDIIDQRDQLSRLKDYFLYFHDKKKVTELQHSHPLLSGVGFLSFRNSGL